MVTSSIRSRETCRSQSSSFNRMDGRHVGTRTPDLYRVNFEVNNLKPFPHLALSCETAGEQTQGSHRSPVDRIRRKDSVPSRSHSTPATDGYKQEQSWHRPVQKALLTA